MLEPHFTLAGRAPPQEAIEQATPLSDFWASYMPPGRYAGAGIFSWNAKVASYTASLNRRLSSMLRRCKELRS